ncbi:AI-2E family transporter [candidate division KSB1 bacterium]|nr:AI-2E family transporter [candidate division KSB1 bacterium]TDJ03782.1 MAG: AI-2E family transporter [Caldithrix sp.]
MSKDQQNKDNGPNSLDKQRAAQFSRVYLLLLLLLTSILFFNLIKFFLVTILLAAVFTALFYPLYEKFLKIFRNNRSASAILCCLALLLGLMIPVYIIADLVSGEAIDLYKTAEPKISEIINKGDEGFLGTIKNYPIVKQFNLDTIDWQSSLQDIAKNMANIIGKVINKTFKGTFQVLTDLFITLFIMFYFFRDGDKLINRIKYLSPLDDRHEEVLMQRFISVSRATIKGTLLIGLAQGTLGGLTLWIFGVASPILWGSVMVILSIIPLVGGWLVLYPAAIIQLILGNTWQGISIMIVAAVVISNVDTLLRPRLVGRDAGMHDLLIFFSTIGGISLFGIMGFIIGPVIAVFFLTILDIYSIEFGATLDIAQDSSSRVEKIKKGKS